MTKMAWSDFEAWWFEVLTKLQNAKSESEEAYYEKLLSKMTDVPVDFNL